MTEPKQTKHFRYAGRIEKVEKDGVTDHKIVFAVGNSVNAVEDLAKAAAHKSKSLTGQFSDASLIRLSKEAALERLAHVGDDIASRQSIEKGLERYEAVVNSVKVIPLQPAVSFSAKSA